MMNPYDVYITKKVELKDKPLPVGKAKVEIEYKGYLANMIDNESQQKQESLKEFIQNRESIQLGIKKNAYGLEMALYKIREGESCNIYIPWRLAYGEKGAGNLIPPKTDILFELTTHRIEHQGKPYEIIRFDKWTKMKQKWNTSKSQNNMLFNKSICIIYPLLFFVTLFILYIIIFVNDTQIIMIYHQRKEEEEEEE